MFFTDTNFIFANNDRIRIKVIKDVKVIKDGKDVKDFSDLNDLSDIVLLFQKKLRGGAAFLVGVLILSF